MSAGRFYVGVAMLTFTTLMLELLETRLLSVVAWYHLAFFVISAAMFGMTAGAIWVHRQGERWTPAGLPRALLGWPALRLGFPGRGGPAARTGAGS
jgi:hypothetical protein